MNASTKIKNMIKGWEGLRLTSYLCPAGVLTVGYGHTGSDVKKGMKITKATAESLLDKDVAVVEQQLNRLIAAWSVKLSQQQYDALLSFTYNLGIGNLQSSTLWRKIKANTTDATIASEFKRWNKSKGVVLEGLTKRRNAEANVYVYGQYL
jgi:lysozyme